MELQVLEDGCHEMQSLLQRTVYRGMILQVLEG